jgi:hypothetical protein
MNLDSLVRALGRESLLVVRSDEELASSVLEAAKEQAKRNPVYAYGKPPRPVPWLKPLSTTPAQVLHELGVATTLLTASPLAQVARHWAHVRYCATLTRRSPYLALSKYADDVVHHHKMTQSEQLGIGLALVVAKAVLGQQHPGWEFHVVDAEVALTAGFISGVGDVDQATGTKKRPDYFLIGRRSAGRHTGFKVIVLECKGTHQNPQFAIEQLARATAQVEALRVAGRTPPSLMVASHLAATRITSYLLDPDGDGDLWSGPLQDMDDLLRGDPHDENWTPVVPAPAAGAAGEGTGPPRVPQDTDTSAPVATETADGQEEPAPAGPYVFNIPEDRRGWFVQILTRAAAATTLLFAGNSAAARDYATPRQRGEAPTTDQQALFDLDQPWATSTATTLHLPNGLHLEGTRYQTPLTDGKVLEVFRGVERRLYSLLANGQIGPYLRAAPSTYRKWSRVPRPSGTVLSLGRDGTALVVRLTNGR